MSGNIHTYIHLKMEGTELSQCIQEPKKSNTTETATGVCCCFIDVTQVTFYLQMYQNYSCIITAQLTLHQLRPQPLIASTSAHDKSGWSKYTREQFATSGSRRFGSGPTGHA